MEVNNGHRAHPEEYAPVDDLDDDILDEESPAALEAATKIGVERLERQPDAHGNGNGNGNGNSNGKSKEMQKEKST